MAAPSEPRLDTRGQGAEVGDALHFIIRQFDAEVVLQAREQLQRLQAVDLELLIEIIGGGKLLARHLEVLCREADDFLDRLFECFHGRIIVQEIIRRPLRQVRMSSGAFHELPQVLHHCRPLYQFAKQVDFPTHLFPWNRFQKPLRGSTGRAVEFADLRRGGACHAQRFLFGGDLADQTDAKSLRRIDASPGEEQVTHDAVAEVALEARDAAKTGDKPQTKFRKAESRQFVGYDEVASQRQLEPPAKGDAVHGGNGGQR